MTVFKQRVKAVCAGGVSPGGFCRGEEIGGKRVTLLGSLDPQEALGGGRLYVRFADRQTAGTSRR